MLALASGGGLIVLVVMSLLRAGEQARAQQELEARDAAAAMATGLRAALRHPAMLQLAQDDAGFVVRGGQYSPPAAIGWLDVAEPDIDPLVAGKLSRAAQAEFALGDPAAALIAFDELLGERGPQGQQRWPVLTAAAWQAHRAGNAVRCSTLAQELDQALAALQPADLGAVSVAEAVASAALLTVARSSTLSPEATRLLPALPPALAVPLFARLRERGVDTAAFERSQQALDTWRALHRRARSALADGAGRGASALSPFLLLWFPEPADGSGQGAILDAAGLAERLRQPAPADLPPVPLLAGLEVTPSRDAIPVVDGALWVAPRRSDADVPWTARPGAALLAAAVLLAVLAGSGLFAIRALRREAAAVRTRADFLTVVTHELKTPLAAIRLLAEMLVEERVPAGRTAEYYRLLAGESARLSMLIDNVLDLGRMERGERAYDLRPCDLGEIAREAATLFAPLAARDGLELRVAIDPAPAVGHADRGALLQALLNVLDNARKYAAAGRAIELRGEPVDGALRVMVRDFGAGVAAGEHEAIFARFRRGDAHRHGSIPGVGLGLHLARTIVRRHGGDLVCGPPLAGGPGAEFTFTLPQTRAAVTEAAP